MNENPYDEDIVSVEYPNRLHSKVLIREGRAFILLPYKYILQTEVTSSVFFVSAVCELVVILPGWNHDSV
jgi:hypothetical protein